MEKQSIARLCRNKDGKFYVNIIFELGRAGTMEFSSIYPQFMSRPEAEARIFRLSEMYGFDRANLLIDIDEI